MAVLKYSRSLCAATAGKTTDKKSQAGFSQQHIQSFSKGKLQGAADGLDTSECWFNQRNHLLRCVYLCHLNKV